jgi:hypothetical protein
MRRVEINKRTVRGALMQMPEGFPIQVLRLIAKENIPGRSVNFGRRVRPEKFYLSFVAFVNLIGFMMQILIVKLICGMDSETTEASFLCLSQMALISCKVLTVLEHRAPP